MKSKVIQKIDLNKDPISNFNLVLQAQKGVDAEMAFVISELLLMPEEDLSLILHLSTKTLKNYQKAEKSLNPIVSEQVLKLNELRKKGEQVFGSVKAFNNWLKKPAIGLDDAIPYEFLQTSGGIDLVMEELDTIAYGDFS